MRLTVIEYFILYFPKKKELNKKTTNLFFDVPESLFIIYFSFVIFKMFFISFLTTGSIRFSFLMKIVSKETINHSTLKKEIALCFCVCFFYFFENKKKSFECDICKKKKKYISKRNNLFCVNISFSFIIFMLFVVYLNFVLRKLSKHFSFSISF